MYSLIEDWDNRYNGNVDTLVKISVALPRLIKQLGCTVDLTRFNLLSLSTNSSSISLRTKCSGIIPGTLANTVVLVILVLVRGSL